MLLSGTLLMMYNPQKVSCLMRGGGGCWLVIIESLMQHIAHSRKPVALITSIVVEGFFPLKYFRLFSVFVDHWALHRCKILFQLSKEYTFNIYMQQQPLSIDITSNPKNVCLFADQNKPVFADVTAQVASNSHNGPTQHLRSHGWG